MAKGEELATRLRGVSTGLGSKVMSSRDVKKRYAGQLSTRRLLTTAVRLGYHIALGRYCLRLTAGS